MPLKSNTAILAECFAALSKRQIERLIWHVEHKTPILTVALRWTAISVFCVSATPAVLANTLAIRHNSADSHLGKRTWRATAKIFYSKLPRSMPAWLAYGELLEASTPRQVRMAIRLAARQRKVTI